MLKIVCCWTILSPLLAHLWCLLQSRRWRSTFLITLHCSNTHHSLMSGFSYPWMSSKYKLSTKELLKHSSQGDSLLQYAAALCSNHSGCSLTISQDNYSNCCTAAIERQIPSPGFHFQNSLAFHTAVFFHLNKARVRTVCSFLFSPLPLAQLLKVVFMVHRLDTIFCSLNLATQLCGFPFPFQINPVCILVWGERVRVRCPSFHLD